MKLNACHGLNLNAFQGLFCWNSGPQMVALFWEVVEPLEIGAKKERQLLGGGVSH